MKTHINRRRFVANSASLVGAGFWLASQSQPAFSVSPNERVSVASIGVGGKGFSDTDDSASVRAMRLGKQVCCQKPLTHSVSEARLMRETAREHGVVSGSLLVGGTGEVTNLTEAAKWIMIPSRVGWAL